MRADYTFSIIPDFVLNANVSHAAVHVYAVLGRYADRDGMVDTTLGELQKLAGMTWNTAKNAVDELVGIEALRVVESGGRGRRSKYVVTHLPGGISMSLSFTAEGQE